MKKTYTTQQVADLLGKTLLTIRRWRAKGVFGEEGVDYKYAGPSVNSKMLYSKEVVDEVVKRYT